MLSFILLLLILVIIVPAAFKSRISTIQNVNQGVDEFYDFIGGDYGPFIQLYEGGGGASVSAGDSVGYYPGNVGTFIQSAGDSVSLVTTPSSSTILYGVTTDFQMRFTPAQALDPSISTSNYKRSGAAGFFADSLYVQNGTAEGAYFYWNGAVSNNLICKYVSSAYTGTFVTSHVFQREDLYIRVVMNPNSTSYYINNVLVNTFIHGSNEQTPTATTQFGFKDYKIDSGATVGLTVDAIKFSQKLSPNRQFRNV